MISWREYIPYKNTHTNNRAEQALETVWKPGHDGERETGITIFQYMSNSNGRNKNTDTDTDIKNTEKNTEYRYRPEIPTPTQL